MDRVHCVGDFLLADPHLVGDFHDRRLPQVFLCQGIPRIERLVRRIPEGAADADGIVVPQIASDLAQDHWHGISRELDVLSDVKVIDGLDQADASDLKQVVHIFIAAGKPLDHA